MTSSIFISVPEQNGSILLIFRPNMRLRDDNKDQTKLFVIVRLSFLVILLANFLTNDDHAVHMTKNVILNTACMSANNVINTGPDPSTDDPI